LPFVGSRSEDILGRENECSLDVPYLKVHSLVVSFRSVPCAIIHSLSLESSWRSWLPFFLSPAAIRLGILSTFLSRCPFTRGSSASPVGGRGVPRLRLTRLTVPQVFPRRLWFFCANFSIYFRGPRRIGDGRGPPTAECGVHGHTKHHFFSAAFYSQRPHGFPPPMTAPCQLLRLAYGLPECASHIPDPQLTIGTDHPFPLRGHRKQTGQAFFSSVCYQSPKRRIPACALVRSVALSTTPFLANSYDSLHPPLPPRRETCVFFTSSRNCAPVSSISPRDRNRRFPASRFALTTTFFCAAGSFHTSYSFDHRPIQVPGLESSTPPYGRKEVFLFFAETPHRRHWGLTKRSDLTVGRTMPAWSHVFEFSVFLCPSFGTCGHFSVLFFCVSARFFGSVRP